MFAFITYLNIFYISGSPWYKTNEYLFSGLITLPAQGGAMDRGGVCLPTGGPLDCSKSSIFLQRTGPKTGAHLDDFTER